MPARRPIDDCAGRTTRALVQTSRMPWTLPPRAVWLRRPLLALAAILLFWALAWLAVPLSYANV